MKGKIDPNKLFNIFQKDDIEIYKEHNAEKEADNPSVVLGMFVRGIENYFILNQIQTEQYGAQYTRIKHKIKHRYFLQLLLNLQRIDLSVHPSIEKHAKDHNYRKILYCLDSMRVYFEDREDYEYCAIIKKYLDACLKPTGPLHQIEVSDNDLKQLLDN